MEFKRNMYARTKGGFIVKLTIFTVTNRCRSWLFDGYYPFASVYEKKIIKTSKNIIDLIEVGDFVNGKRVLEVKEQGYIVEDNIVQCLPIGETGSLLRCPVNQFISKDCVENVTPSGILNVFSIQV